MLNRFLLLCAILFAGVFQSSVAAVIENLYQARVEVADQSQRAQQRALTDALKQVLIKVSGDRAILQSDDIKRHIKNANSFLHSYQFDFEQDTTFYQAQFNPQRIETAIRASDFPVWGKRRPDSLIWLAIEDQPAKQRRLVSEADLTIRESIDQVAEQRGIAVALPILDLTDIQQVSVYDVWGSYVQNIMLVSDRYQVDYVMSARIYFHSSDPLATSADELDESMAQTAPVVKETDVWIAQWLVMHRGQLVSGMVSGDTVDSVIQQITHLLADKQAKDYAVDVNSLSADDRRAQIVVDNVSSIQSYQSLSDFLSSLTVIMKATLVEMQGSQVRFDLELLGDQQDVVEALRLDDRIKPKVDSFGQAIDPMHFVWGQ